jgi:tetratricopeptide (TPR) repeat protein
MEKTLISPTVEISFYESLHSRYPDDWEIIKVLADYYMEARLYPEALNLDEQIIAQFPNDALAHYNYACSLCRNHQLEASLAALQKAVDLGYSNWDYLLHDHDLAELRDLPQFPQWVQNNLPGKSWRAQF